MADDDADAVLEMLEPQARALIKALLNQRDRQLAAQTEQIAALTQQVANLTQQVREFQRMIFGRRCERLPPIESEVRRVVEADELTVDGEPMPKDEAKRTHEKRRIARKKSEPARKHKRRLKKNLPVLHECVEVEASDLPEA